LPFFFFLLPKKLQKAGRIASCFFRFRFVADAERIFIGKMRVFCGVSSLTQLRSARMIRNDKVGSKLCACSTRHAPNGRLSAAVVAQHGKGLRPVASPAAESHSQRKLYPFPHSAVGDA
jgi:hypothetical protein